MKTILINVFNTAVAKNIFMPDFLCALSEREDVRCVVAAPASKVEEWKRDWASPRLEFVARQQQYASSAENIVLFLARNMIPTWTVRQIQEEGLDGSGRLSPFPKYLLARLAWLFGHASLMRAFLKHVSMPFFDDSVFAEILDAYKPSLVFATTTYAVDDVRLLKAAKKRGIRTLGMIKSWDNLTSKDMLLAPPDQLVVHNSAVADEAMRFHGYRKDEIAIVGVPQFDWYADPSLIEPREAFFARLGLDLQKTLITYNAMGRWLVPHERDIIATLYEIVTSGSLAYPAQLLVRMHPAYPDDESELRLLFPGIVVDEPGSPVKDSEASWKADWKFSIDDIRHLASTLAYSAVTINCGSTTIIDAACLDAPVIGIAFDGEAVEPSYWLGARRLFDREHCKKAVETGGVLVAYDKDSLKSAINSYLADRSLGSDGRKRLVAQQAGEIGHASERLARALLKTLQ
ncbi:MAG TPA: hypothetical protein VJK53_03725 [Candidatus Paceibacterota bacterium]